MGHPGKVDAQDIKLKSLMLAIWSALNTLENTSGEDLTALMMSF